MTDVAQILTSLTNRPPDASPPTRIAKGTVTFETVLAGQAADQLLQTDAEAIVADQSAEQTPAPKNGSEADGETEESLRKPSEAANPEDALETPKVVAQPDENRIKRLDDPSFSNAPRPKEAAVSPARRQGLDMPLSGDGPVTKREASDSRPDRVGKTSPRPNVVGSQPDMPIAKTVIADDAKVTTIRNTRAPQPLSDKSPAAAAPHPELVGQPARPSPDGQPTNYVRVAPQGQATNAKLSAGLDADDPRNLVPAADKPKIAPKGTSDQLSINPAQLRTPTGVTSQAQSAQQAPPASPTNQVIRPTESASLPITDQPPRAQPLQDPKDNVTLDQGLSAKRPQRAQQNQVIKPSPATPIPPEKPGSPPQVLPPQPLAGKPDGARAPDVSQKQSQPSQQLTTPQVAAKPIVKTSLAQALSTAAQTPSPRERRQDVAPPTQSRAPISTPQVAAPPITQAAKNPTIVEAAKHIGLVESPLFDPAPLGDRHVATQSTSQSSTAVQTSVPSAPTEQARQIAAQIAHSVRTVENGTTEIRLDPAELGKVRMTLRSGDGGLAMMIFAERPETADLMRRHIDQLAQEFRALGLSNLSFQFAGSGNQSQTHDHQPFSPAGDTALDPMQSPAPATPQVPQASGLDIRI